MITETQILAELQKINHQLSRQNSTIIKSFSYGFFHSLGYFFGTAMVFFIFIYLASQFDWTRAMSKSIETMMSQVNWNKVIPAPTFEFPVQQDQF